MTQPIVPEPATPAVQDAGYGSPRRGATARVLTTLGVLLGVVAVGFGALFLVDLAMSETTTSHHTYDAVGTVELVTDGDVTVTAAEGDVEVDAVAHSGLREPRYSAEESGDRLEVTHRCGWSVFLPRCSGDLDVTLPAGTEVVVRTENGDVVAGGLAGEVTLHTSNGEVEATDVAGSLFARSSNGDVTVTGAGSDVEVSSSNGDLTVRDVDGTVTGGTSNGRVTVEEVTGDASVRSSNGSVEVSGVGGDVDAQTSNGDVTVTGDDEPVALTIETSNGRETIDGPTDPDADRTVRIRSSNGDVTYLVP
ncbi:DUF4097 domain-containing protein [Promicromonospora thailandica]|uniref:Adhesin n=1 Tax=Promicromonospora thailandica TaxID=765201 RepID=A0A9X2G3U9_9MICO|nr:DUF4097 family beta strand repeat-containing protein [Promicromonospora thailandica]MCP2266339.1 putative adhesin [Promicromonospora thailandica]BFF20012.1 hypothetical protein GCM10025730_35330 [Promicromonospora thailandica]